VQDHSLDNAIAQGHEAPAPSLRPVWWSAFALVVLAVSTLLLIFGLMRLFAASLPPAPAASTFRAENELPAAAPRLGVNLAAELQHVLIQQRTILGQLAWVDRPAGIARIPIEDAIALAAKNGLPKNFATPPTQEGKK
jgi:hypothetical protein